MLTGWGGDRSSQTTRQANSRCSSGADAPPRACARLKKSFASHAMRFIIGILLHQSHPHRIHTSHIHLPSRTTRSCAVSCSRTCVLQQVCSCCQQARPPISAKKGQPLSAEHIPSDQAARQDERLRPSGLWAPRGGPRRGLVAPRSVVVPVRAAATGALGKAGSS